MITMRRPGKAIDAAMLTATIWIDGPIEMDVGRFVKGNNCPWSLFGQRCLQSWQWRLKTSPTIIQSLARFTFVPPGLVRNGASTPMMEAFAHFHHRGPAHPAVFRELLFFSHAVRNHSTQNKARTLAAFPQLMRAIWTGYPGLFSFNIGPASQLSDTHAC